eukprot:PITA_12594
MNEEIGAIEKSKTWELVDLPEGKDAIRVKWVYKTKSNAEGKIDRHKARLVVKGYMQQQGKDYDETFSPVASMETEVYVEQPPGYEVVGQEHKVCKLKKALYGLKQALRAWYSRIDAYLIENGFDKCDGEPTLYIKENDVDQSENGVFISQDKYVEAVLKRFNLQNSKAAATPTVVGLKLTKEESRKDFDLKLYKSIVGSLMYLTATRPDIMHAVSLISRFMERPKETHWQAAKRILRYMNGTKGFGILYSFSESFVLIGYTDSDWDGSVDDRKSTSGYVFHMGSVAISWASKKQPVVSLSTAKAEYVAATAATCQAVWLRRVLRDLCHERENGTTIYCDNSSAIALSKNSFFYKRTKHMDTKFHLIVNWLTMVRLFCSTAEQRIS